jgi:hypothetical protein
MVWHACWLHGGPSNGAIQRQTNQDVSHGCWLCAGRFVQKLREAAQAVPSITIREGLVRRLINGGSNTRRLLQ